MHPELEWKAMSMFDPEVIKRLKEVGARPEGKFFATVDSMRDLVKAGFVEGNKALVDPADHTRIVYRLTPTGKEALAWKPPKEAKAMKSPKATPKKAAKPVAAKPAAAAKPARAPRLAPSTSEFLIADDVPLPAPRRQSIASKYPFANLKNGQSFFVEKGVDAADPVKTFGTAVSEKNKAYRLKDDFRFFQLRHMVLDETTAKKYGRAVGAEGAGIFRASAEVEAQKRKEHFPK